MTEPAIEPVEPPAGTTSWDFTNVAVPEGTAIGEVELDLTNVPATAHSDVAAALGAAGELFPDSKACDLQIDMAGWSNGVQNSITVVVTNTTNQEVAHGAEAGHQSDQGQEAEQGQ